MNTVRLTGALIIGLAGGSRLWMDLGWLGVAIMLGAAALGVGLYYGLRRADS